MASIGRGPNISTQIHELGNSLAILILGRSGVNNGVDANGQIIDPDWGYRLGSCVESEYLRFILVTQQRPYG